MNALTKYAEWLKKSKRKKKKKERKQNQSG